MHMAFYTQVFFAYSNTIYVFCFDILTTVSASTPRSGGETGKAGGTSAEGASFERRRREHRGAEGAE